MESKKHILFISRLIAVACLASMALCFKLWLNERSFPTSPTFSFLPNINHPLDYILLVLTFAFLLLIIFRPQKIVLIITLSLLIILALFDLNRWQPWYYQYILMLFLLCFVNFKKADDLFTNNVLVSFKIMIAAVYIWSGLQKFNPNFLSDTYPWLMEPTAKYLGESFVKKINWLGYAFPAIETITGILLLFRRTQKVGVILVTTMHIFILFTLSPLGHNYNAVVWPWNIFMIIVNYYFAFKIPGLSFQELKFSLKYNSIRIVFLLFVLMPLGNFFNQWDSYLSHNLYSGNTSNGIIYFSDSAQYGFPQNILEYSDKVENSIHIKYWCMKELGVPAYPEKRNFERITKSLYKYVKDSTELYLEYTPKIKVAIQ